MNEIFMLNAEKPLTDGPATIQVFHDQANLPNFKTHWKQIITENALVPMRFRLRPLGTPNQNVPLGQSSAVSPYRSDRS